MQHSTACIIIVYERSMPLYREQ